LTTEEIQINHKKEEEKVIVTLKIITKPKITASLIGSILKHRSVRACRANEMLVCSRLVLCVHMCASPAAQEEQGKKKKRKEEDAAV
jgi:hypothetical protein